MAADQVAAASDEKMRASVGRTDVPDFVVMSVKMRRAEADAFRALCADLGVRPNRAFRTMARHASGYLEIGGTVEDELRVTVRQLRGIATNVNQIAKAANRTRTPDYADFMRERAALGPVLMRLSIQTRRILDVSARRLDGRERLKAVLDQRPPAENMVNERA